MQIITETDYNHNILFWVVILHKETVNILKRLNGENQFFIFVILQLYVLVSEKKILQVHLIDKASSQIQSKDIS